MRDGRAVKEDQLTIQDGQGIGNPREHAGDLVRLKFGASKSGYHRG